MRFSRLVLLASSLVGCARPNYAGPPTAPVSRAEAGCLAHFNGGDDCVTLQWETLAFGRRADSSFVFKIGRPNKADGAVIVAEADAVDVTMSMPEMGHGTGPIAVDRLDVGTYRARGIRLDHGGLYLIRFRRHVGGRPDDEASLRLTL